MWQGSFYLDCSQTTFRGLGQSEQDYLFFQPLTLVRKASYAFMPYQDKTWFDFL
jgi:hypothetical protein